MDRDEILRRSRDSKKNKDEGVQFMEQQARRYGEIGLCGFFILLAVYKLIKGQPANDLLAVIWGYIGVSNIYKYRYSRTKQALTAAVCGVLAAVCFTAAYVLQTW